MGKKISKNKSKLKSKKILNCEPSNNGFSRKIKIKKQKKGTRLFTKLFKENKIKMTYGLRMPSQIHGISDEDIVQEAFLKCWIKRGRINPDENPLGYIRKTAENTRNGTFNSNLSKKKIPHSPPDSDNKSHPLHHISLEFLADESSYSSEDNYMPRYSANMNNNGMQFSSQEFDPESVLIENNRILFLQKKLDNEEKKILECLINPEEELIEMSIKEIKIEEKNWGEKKNHTITDRHIAAYIGVRLVDVKNVKKKIIQVLKKMDKE